MQPSEPADMENEGKLVNQNKMKLMLKLEVLDILKEAVTIYFRNINFVIFTFLASLPFFCVMVHFEILFQETLVETPEIMNRLLLHFYHRYDERNFVYDIFPSVTIRSFSKDYLPVLIHLGFIYFVLLHVLELFSAVVTIDVAAKLRSEENKMSLKQMFQKSIDISILKGSFITSLYKLFLSACLLIAFPWTVSNCYSFYKTVGCYMFFAVICCVVLAKLLMMYLELSVIWNMSIVISVLDGIYGVGAFRLSYFFSSGNQKRGLVLMLVFFVLGLCLRLSCVSLGCYKGGYGIFLQIGLLYVVNTLKWVSCMIYFNDCRERKMEKNVVEELGKDLESNS